MKKIRKKREYLSSELVHNFAKIYGFESKLLAFEVKDFLEEYFDDTLFSEIESVNLEKTTLKIKINSPLLKNDFQLRKSFYLKKFQDKFGIEKFSKIEIF
jgi:hypothetical protein